LLRRTWGSRCCDKRLLADDSDEEIEAELAGLSASSDDEAAPAAEANEPADEPAEPDEDDEPDEDEAGEPGAPVYTAMLRVQLVNGRELLVRESSAPGGTVEALASYLPEGATAADVESIEREEGWFYPRGSVDADGDADEWVGPFASEEEAEADAEG